MARRRQGRSDRRRWGSDRRQRRSDQWRPDGGRATGNSERQWRGLAAAPRQRNTEAEKAAVKAGKTAAGIWPEKPAKARQKGEPWVAIGSRPMANEARWRRRFSKAKPAADGKPRIDIAIPSFGYKPRIAIGRRHGIIRRGLVSDAAAHDGARLREGLIDPNNTASGVWADSACRSEANENFLRAIGKAGQIHRRKPKGKPMPRRAAKPTRPIGGPRPCRASPRPQKGIMGLAIRTTRRVRAEAAITLSNMACNMKR